MEEQGRLWSNLTEVLDLPGATRFGAMLVVRLDNGVSLDFHAKEGKGASQHYAFVTSEDRDRRLEFWAHSGKQRPGEINHNDGGRGVYFEDSDGHLLEVITRPYGSGG
jgi:hypothetical protein